MLMENIILIGMPGSGKSTVGVLLAKAVGFDFLDTDLLITRREGMKLQKILDRFGLKAFLDCEQRAVLSVNARGTVIATGGSVICREASMKHLKKLGKIVYLEVEYEELLSRIKNITTRGIAFAEGETLADIFVSRTPLYRKYADITVTVPKNSHIETVVENTVRALGEFDN